MSRADADRNVGISSEQLLTSLVFHFIHMLTSLRNECLILFSFLPELPCLQAQFHLSDHSTKAGDSMPLKLHAIEDWSRKRLVSELGSATFEFDPPMNQGSRSTYVLSFKPSFFCPNCLLPSLPDSSFPKKWMNQASCHSPFIPTWIKEAKPLCQRVLNGMPYSSTYKLFLRTWLKSFRLGLKPSLLW